LTALVEIFQWTLDNMVLSSLVIVAVVCVTMLSLKPAVTKD
jgi:hypothetical protein